MYLLLLPVINLSAVLVLVPCLTLIVNHSDSIHYFCGAAIVTLLYIPIPVIIIPAALIVIL